MTGGWGGIREWKLRGENSFWKEESGEARKRGVKKRYSRGLIEGLGRVHSGRAQLRGGIRRGK